IREEDAMAKPFQLAGHHRTPAAMMGWISKRHMEQGGSINRNPRNNGARKGPLRLISAVLVHGSGLFDVDRVRFSCGHEGRATIRARRGRCVTCRALPGTIELERQ